MWHEAISHDACGELLPAYVDYMVTGQPLPDVTQLERHLASCPECAQEYVTLLGMVLNEQAEKILDVSLIVDRDNPSALVQSLEDAGIHLDLFSCLVDHWLETCRDELVQDERSAATALSAKGLLLEKMGHLDEAMNCYQEALTLASRTGNDHSRSRAVEGKGRIELMRSNIRQAREHLLGAFQIGKELRDEFAQARSLLLLGDVHARRGHIASSINALAHYRRGNQIAERIGYAAAEVASSRRLVKQADEVAKSLQEVVEGFVEKYARSEVVKLSQISQEFATQLSHAPLLAPLDPTPYLRLAVPYVESGDAKTPVLLCAVAVAIQDVILPKLEDVISQEEADDRSKLLAALEAYLQQNAVRRRIRDTARQYGLSLEQAERFCGHFAKLASEKPGLLGDVDPIARAWQRTKEGLLLLVDGIGLRIRRIKPEGFTLALSPQSIVMPVPTPAYVSSRLRGEAESKEARVEVPLPGDAGHIIVAFRPVQAEEVEVVIQPIVGEEQQRVTISLYREPDRLVFSEPVGNREIFRFSSKISGHRIRVEVGGQMYDIPLGMAEVEGETT